MKLKVTTLLFGLGLLLVTGCREFYEYLNEVEPKPVRVKEYATKLNGPIGLALDANKQLWVTEIGTGKNDGKVSVFKSNGKKYVVIDGFPSFFGPGGQEEIVGLNHLAVKDGKIYILHTNGLLYMANINSYKIGDPPLKANKLTKQNIGSFVMNYPFKVKPEESNPYNLTFGPQDNLYITDAGANAVIRRSTSGKLSVFTTFEDIANPTKLGPPTIDPVPTSIAFNKQHFYVTTLTGFPFPTGKARIYSVDLAGNVSIYQEGFTTLTDMTLDPAFNPVVVEHAQFTEQGFAPNTGKIVIAADDGQATFALLSFTFLSIDSLLPVPSSLLMILNGKILGVFWGTVVSSLSSLLSSVFGFYLGRSANSFFDRFFSAQDKEFSNNFFQKFGNTAILISKALPILSEAVSFVAGTTTLSFKTFILYSAIGHFVISLVYGYLGYYSNSVHSGVVTIIIVMGTVLLGWLVQFLLKK